MSAASSVRVALVLAVALLAAGCPKAAGNDEEAIHVKLATLQRTEIEDSTDYVAALKSRQSIALQPLVEGQLTRIFVKPGDKVEADQPLMQIDPKRQRATVIEARAAQSSRVAVLRYAQHQYERAQQLFAAGAMSKQDLEQARSNYKAAQADASMMGAQVRENQVQLDYYRIVAPARGIVGDIPVRVGATVTPSTKLTTIDQNGILECNVSVPVEKAKQVKIGMPLSLLDAEGAVVAKSTISFVSPQVNEETQSVLLKSDIANEDNSLRAAQFVRARVVWSSHPGVIVPAIAVTRVNGQTFVFVAETKSDNGRRQLVAKQRAVTLGELNNDGYPALAGVEPGDQLVVGGVQKLLDGTAIVADGDDDRKPADKKAGDKGDDDKGGDTTPKNAAH